MVLESGTVKHALPMGVERVSALDCGIMDMRGPEGSP